MVLVVLFAMSAEPAAARPCKGTWDWRLGGELQRDYVAKGRDGLLTAVATCDRRTQRRTVVRRALLRYGPREGTEIIDVDHNRRTLAWTEERYSRRGSEAWLVLADIRTGAVRSRRRIGSALGSKRRPLPIGLRDGARPEVALDGRGTLAHGAFDRNRRWFVVRQLGYPPQRVDANDGWKLGIEDGWTLRWVVRDEMQYLELPGAPRATGCPTRRRFAPARVFPEVEVSTARYRVAPDSIDVTRACLRSTGQDPIVGQTSFYGTRPSHSIEVRIVDRTWIVLLEWFSGKGTEGMGYEMRTLDLRTMQPGRGGRVPDSAYAHRPPVLDLPGAVTTEGVPAWFATTPYADHLFTLSAEGETVELDRGTAGSINGLRADGQRLVWTKYGEPRSADP